MIYAFISDIHGKADRLQKALKSLHQRGFYSQNILCLGDIVSEKAEDSSNECVELLRKSAILTVRGNHEDYALAKRPGHLSKETLDYLASLPEYVRIGGLFIVHDNPIMSTREGAGFLARNNHIETDDDAAEVFAAGIKKAVVGHNHKAKVYWDGGSESLAEGGVFDFSPSEKYIFCPGAVSFPRDENPNPSCAILDLEKNTFEVIRPN